MSLPRRSAACGWTLLLLASSLASLLGCVEPRKANRLSLQATSSRVDVFLRPSGSQSEAVVLELAYARLVDADGREAPLDLARSSVRSDEPRTDALAGGRVDPSAYTALVLGLRAAHLEAGDARVPLDLLPPAGAALPPVVPGAEVSVEYEVPLRLGVRRREAASVFLEWDVDASVLGRSGFRPSITTSVERAGPTLGRLYVTDAATGSVLCVDRSSGRIVATTQVGAQPLGLAISEDRRRLYVANAGEGSLSIVDIRQDQTTSTLPVRFSAGTCDVVLASSPRVAAVTNSNLNTVSFLDVVDSTRLGDVQVGLAPRRLAVAPSVRRLFVVDTRSDTLSVLDVSSRALVAQVALEAEPTDVTIGRRQREVFVGHRTSRNLLVIDVVSLAVVDSIFVGGEVGAVLADRRRDRIFVARSHPDELLVVDRRLAAVVRRIPVSGAITSLAQPVDGPYVYGAAPELGAVIVVDVLSYKEEAPIPCGTRPTDVAVVD